MLWRVASALFNRLPVRVQRAILDRAHPRFLVGVNGVGVTADGRVILGRHRFGDPEWRLLGGFISRHETLEDALAREVREETGLAIEVGTLLEASTGDKWARVELVYSYRPTGGVKHLSAELLDVRAFPPDALPPLRADHRAIVARHLPTVVAWTRSRTDPATIEM